ncbi:MAG: UMP kinase [Bacteroidales bacterium]|nr:UMP kinase [Bacteroidales bacterium]MCF8388787.1 UMP kinase [Bacteroidales bacterium]MCF8399227.1 UMP kinase [Bacteroidales bacterium]
MKYNRILLKLSGEALMGSKNYGLDPERLKEYAFEIKGIYDQGVQIAIVIGGGNIYRGLQGSAEGLDRVQGDYMGMLATIINGMALQGAFQQANMKVKLLSGLPVDPVAEKSSGPRAIEYLEQGTIVIITGGTGNPFFTTDTASALRAVEIKADVLLKGTRVDGVYTADPEKDPDATKYDSLSFDEAYSKGLKIMDLTAFALCKENSLAILVFDMNRKGNLQKIIQGEKVGTIVK